MYLSTFHFSVISHPWLITILVFPALQSMDSQIPAFLPEPLSFLGCHDIAMIQNLQSQCSPRTWTKLSPTHCGHPAPEGGKALSMSSPFPHCISCWGCRNKNSSGGVTFSQLCTQYGSIHWEGMFLLSLALLGLSSHCLPSVKCLHPISCSCKNTSHIQLLLPPTGPHFNLIILSRFCLHLGMVEHACDSNIKEVEAGSLRSV